VSLRGSPQTRLSRPLLPLLLAALLVFAPFGAGGRSSATAAGVGDCTAGADWGTVRGDLAAQVVSLVNQHRAGLGLAGLAGSAKLTAAATWKARHMAYYGYFSHDDPAPPVARSTRDRIAACGYTAGWGENIAYGQSSAASVMQSWLGSPGHKANIEGSYRAIGVGVAAAASGRLYWAQVFGTVADRGSPPPPAPPVPRPSPPPTPPTPPAPTPRTPTTVPAPRAPTATTASVPTPSPPAAPAAKPSAPAKTRPTSDAARAPQLDASTLIQWGRRPRAGRSFTGRLMISHPETRERVRTGRVTCNARAAGRPVWVGIHRFRKGFVVCRWWIPRVAQGHRIIGTIRVRAGGKRTARWFSRVVR
jgi:uncharacterized protein YkwD